MFPPLKFPPPLENLAFVGGENFREDTVPSMKQPLRQRANIGISDGFYVLL